MLNTRHFLVILALIFGLSPPTIHATEPSTRPMLRIETGMHTAVINRIGVDTAERFLLTASDDKTLRLWDLHTGDLLKTYRVPIGTGNEGKLYSGAISPDGKLVAAAGWTKAATNSHNVYLFNRATGQLAKRLAGLEQRVLHLCFSPDGHYLGASLGTGQGIRVLDTQSWQLIFSDMNYADDSYWCDFDQQNRLVTSSWDGHLRLYSPSSNSFTLSAQIETLGGKQPFATVFSPAGDKIAVGFQDSTNVNVYGDNLAFLYAPDTAGINKGNLMAVAWSQDGKRLYAGGMYDDGSGVNPVLHWPLAGLGSYTEWQASINTIMDIRSLKNGSIIYGAYDPAFAILDNSGNKIVEQEASIADYRGIFLGNFVISYDGSIIHFGLEFRGKRPTRFSLSEQSLILSPLQDANLTTPDTSSLNITGWKNTLIPKINGKALFLEPNEFSRSLAIAPDKSKFLLGAEWHLRLFDMNGQQIWKVAAPSAAWGVNISGDGKKAVAAFGDGTIRWYNMANGEELLAFFPHKDGQRWIAWTKSGYYMGSADNADNLIGWHVNEGKDKAASFYPVGALFANYKRPDIVKKILVTLDEDEAIRLANLEKEEVVEPPVTVGKALAEVKDEYQVNLKPSGLGKAIIVAASGAQDSNSLFPYTLEFTTEMYRFIHQQGFSDDDVIFMNPRLPIVPANNYPDAARQDFPMRDPKTELQQAVAIASQDLQPGEQFVFYLHGHARTDSVRIGKTLEMSAQEIKELLAQIPTGVEQIIILDTCYSGSFLDELAGVPNRVVITSADAKSLAWSTETKSFAEKFIRQLRYGSSIGEAFELAEKMIMDDPKTFGEQNPQLDDTQDGLYTSNDSRFAGNIYLGGQKVHASLPPEITEIHPTIQLTEGQTTATLWVKAFPDFNGMKQVRAILVNELDEVTQYQGESTNFTRRELTLLPNYDLQRYEIDYNQFHTANNWKIRYQAQSMEGDWSEISEGYAISANTTTIEATLNQTTYRVGDNIRFDVTLSGDALVDLYVGVIFPDGYYKTIAYPLTFSDNNVLLPYKTGIQLTSGQTFHILSLDLPAIAVGDYQACGLVTRAGSDPVNNANWLNLHCKGFNFQ